MRNRSVLVLLAAGVAISVAVPLSVAAKPKVDATATAKNGCGKGQVARSVNGTRSCVRAKARRIAPARLTSAAAVFDQSLRGPVFLRRKDGKAFLPVVPAKVRSLLVAEADRAGSDFDEAFASARTTSAQEYTPGKTVLVSESGVEITRELAPPTVSGDRVTTRSTVTTSLSGAALAAARLDEGRGASGPGISMTQGTELSGDGKSYSESRTLDVKNADGGALKSLFGGTTRVRNIPQCPSGDGKISVETDGAFTIRGSADQQFGPIKTSGKYTMTIAQKTRATAQMSPDAEVQPFQFTVTTGVDEASSTSALLFQGLYRFSGTATLTGTLDPKTGTVTETSITSTPKVFFSASPPAAQLAAAKAAWGRNLEALARKQPAELLEQIRAVETRARAGRCTSIALDPGSPATLQPGAKTTVKPDFRYPAKGTPVTWTATATKGTVTPATSTATDPTFTVTGAKAGAETANVTFRAVSPAGISEATWIAKSRAELPAAYEGTFTVSQVLDGGRHEDSSGTFRWVRTAQAGRYELASGSGTLVTSGTVTGPCVISGTKSGAFSELARTSSLLTVADLTNPSAPIGFDPAPGPVSFTPPDPARPVYISLNAVFPGDPGVLETFSCPSGSSQGNIVGEPSIVSIGTPLPAFAPDLAFSVADTAALDGTFTERRGVAVTTSTWQLRAVPG